VHFSAAAGTKLWANDAQKAAWCQTIEAFDEGSHHTRQIAMFPEDRMAPALDCDVVHVRLSELRLNRPRQGAPVGWPANCGTNCNWTNSGRHDCRHHARGHAG
jgi:hypothetical protein